MRVTQVAGITDAGLKPRPMKVIAVLGGGLMGSGIATAAAQAGCQVLLKEINQKFLDVRACRCSKHKLHQIAMSTQQHCQDWLPWSVGIHPEARCRGQ